MPSCPQCNKPLAALARWCPSCRADLDLLVEYVNGLQTGLDQAEKLTRAGELGQAVWAYLSVLDIDPDNAAARRQVGDVVMAVRYFDRIAPTRRGLSRIWHGQGSDGPGPRIAGWLWIVLVGLLMVVAFGLGYGMASSSAEGQPQPHDPPKLERPSNTLG